MVNKMEINNTDEKKERALLISVDTGRFNADISLKELEELAKTAGAEVVGTSVQKRPTPEVATYVGTGFLYDITRFCEHSEIDLIIADDELTPIQIRNIEDETNTRVIDRTTLILDIFAGRARSKEGKLQIELAQLKYSLPRLTGKGVSLSRLGGGIGTRGPGETKLESDKRHIRRRIQNIKEELDKVKSRRDMLHERRKKNGAISVAIVGYTNAGKSTLMNKLTDAGVLQEDKLFATLDPTARKLVLPNGQQIMLIDTVGFISRLPHQLVDAFRSTLEEATYADLILNVCDASSAQCYDNIATTNSILTSLFPDESISVPVITVFNKCDLSHSPSAIAFPFADAKTSVKISAKTGEGIDDLLLAIQNALPQTKKRVKLLIPFSKGSIINDIRNDGVIHSEEYTADGTVIDATVDIVYLNRIEEYIVN